MSLIENGFGPKTWANWTEAFATFLAIYVAIGTRSGLSAYIFRNGQNSYSLHVTNLGTITNYFKILKVVNIFGINRLDDNKENVGTYKHFHAVPVEKVFPLTDDISINLEDDFDQGNHTIKKKSLITYVYLKDIHHKYYILDFLDNNLKSYNWLSFKFKNIYDFISKKLNILKIKSK